MSKYDHMISATTLISKAIQLESANFQNDQNNQFKNRKFLRSLKKIITSPNYSIVQDEKEGLNPRRKLSWNK